MIERFDRINFGTSVSNAGRNGGAYGNAVVIVAWACLVRELSPILLAVLNAAGLA